MKKKIFTVLAVLAVIVALATSFIACDKNETTPVTPLGMSVLTKDYEPESTSSASMTKVDSLGNYTVLSTTDTLMFASMTKADEADPDTTVTTYVVYNMKCNVVVYTRDVRPYALTSSYSSLNWGNAFFTVNVTQDQDTTLTVVSFYNGNGQQLISVDTAKYNVVYNLGSSYVLNPSRYNSSQNTFDLGDGKYLTQTEDGDVVVRTDNSNEQFTIPYEENDVDLETTNYAIVYETGNYLTILDKTTLQEVRTIDLAVKVTGAPAADNMSIGRTLLPGDKMLVQIEKQLPVNTTDGYTYYNSDGYYKVETYVYDIATDQVVEYPDFAYIVSSTQMYVPDSVSVLSVYKINTDKSVGRSYIVQGFDGALNVVLDLQAKLPGAAGVGLFGDKIMLNNGVELQIYDGDEMIASLRPDRVNVSNLVELDGKLYFVSNDGKTVFDVEGNVVASLGNLGADGLVGIYGSMFLYTKTEIGTDGNSEKNLYAKDITTGRVDKIGLYADADMSTLSGVRVMIMSKGEGKYDYYDVETMNKIGSDLGAVSTRYSYDGGVVVVIAGLDEEGNPTTTYYNISK